MAKGNKNAHAVRRATGWSYARSLRFVKNQDRSNEAGRYMKDQEISKREAFVAIALAHVEETSFEITPEFFFGDGTRPMRLGTDWMTTGKPAEPVEDD